MIALTQSTLADLTEVWRRKLRASLCEHVLCGYRVGGFSPILSIVSLTDTIVFFILRLRGVLHDSRAAQGIGGADTG